jgi:hypothetical protein
MSEEPDIKPDWDNLLGHEVRLKQEEERRERLTIHYRNEQIYSAKLRGALEEIRRVAIENWDNDASLIAEAARNLCEKALRDELRPPHPLAHFYDQGHHTGHPHAEYLFLPTADYVDPDAPPPEEPPNSVLVEHTHFWDMAREIRAYCEEHKVHVAVFDNRDNRTIGFAVQVSASDPLWKVWRITLANASRTANDHRDGFENLTDEEMVRIIHPHLMSSYSRFRIAVALSTGQMPG